MRLQRFLKLVISTWQCLASAGPAKELLTCQDHVNEPHGGSFQPARRFVVHILAAVTILRDSSSIIKSICCLLTVCSRIQTTEIQLKETPQKLTSSHIYRSRSNDTRKRPQGSLNLRVKVIVKGLFHADNKRQLLKSTPRTLSRSAHHTEVGPASCRPYRCWAVCNHRSIS